MRTKKVPKECVCKVKYNINHALMYQTGGFITLRHNRLADVTAELLARICKDVSQEPALSATSATNDELQANIGSLGFWQKMQRAFSQNYPFAPRYRFQRLESMIECI